MVAPQHGGDFRHAHRRAGVAGFGLFDHIHAQGAEYGGGGPGEIARAGGGTLDNVHGTPYWDRCWRSISRRISGVRISCMARSSLLPAMTMLLARDMKLPAIIDSR